MQKIFNATLKLGTKEAAKQLKSFGEKLKKEAQTKSLENGTKKVTDNIKKSRDEASKLQRIFEKIKNTIKDSTPYKKFESALLKVKKVAQGILAVFKFIGKAVTIIVGLIVGALGAVYGAVRGSIEKRRESQLGGLTMRQRDAAEYAAKQTGLDVDWKAINAARYDPGNAAIQRLRGDKSDSEWQKMDNFARFKAIVAQLQKDERVKNPNEAIAASTMEALGYTEALGMSKQDLITAMKSGLLNSYIGHFGEGMSIYGKQNYGEKVSQEQSFNRKEAQMSSAITAGLTKVGEKLNSIVDMVSDFIPKLYKLFAYFVEKFDAFVNWISNTALGRGMKSIGSFLSNGFKSLFGSSANDDTIVKNVAEIEQKAKQYAVSGLNQITGNAEPPTINVNVQNTANKDGSITSKVNATDSRGRHLETK